MDRALSAAASGMEAQDLKLSVIANNLANVNTNGFKKTRAEFQDLLYDNMRSVGTESANGEQLPTGLQVGQGVRASGTQRIFSTGDIRQTNNTLDIAIEGDGFFQVQMPNGEVGYTRDGALKMDSQGRLVTTDGMPLVPQITVPASANEIRISRDGLVSCVEADRSQVIELGSLSLARFANPAGLSPLGHNLFMSTQASGDALLNVPGTMGLGPLAQGFIEGSNVKAVDEMIDIITSQRAYEFDSRVIQAADQMLSTTSQLR